MCSGSEAGSYLRFIDFVYLSTLGLRVIKKKRRAFPTHAERRTAQVTVTLRPYPEYSRANSYPWSPPPPRRARPGPGPHTQRARLTPARACGGARRRCRAGRTSAGAGRRDLRAPVQSLQGYREKCREREKRERGLAKTEKWAEKERRERGASQNREICREREERRERWGEPKQRNGQRKREQRGG